MTGSIGKNQVRWRKKNSCGLDTLIFVPNERFPELRFSATLGREPEVELALV